ncbi:hypothetical protein MIMGU_mgv1a012145mg [Erythranthe guttata]|uniref:Clp R domain-containing protein n=1 Tax=Erythranthe guttata TaxID=4155 RepID=A0A022QSB1_ERYGU|nr:hypothetical protein MIMGU_mgv1a012145mg [Erythranthe guttata]
MAARSLSATSLTRPEFKQFNPNKPSQDVLKTQWVGTISTTKLSLHSSNLRPFFTKRPLINATISFSLPTAKPERVSATEKIPKWSSKAIKAYAMGELEARKIKSPTTGTEAILMGILIEGGKMIIRCVFWLLCIRNCIFTQNEYKLDHIPHNLDDYVEFDTIRVEVRDEIFKMRGKPDMYFFSPEHPPLTEAAQTTLDWAIDEKLTSGENGEITTSHLLLGLWKQEESPGHQILVALGFNDDKAKELRSFISEPTFEGDS